MRYRYTVRGGYDRLLRKRIERGTLFAVPIAVMAIVGLAALTSNTTHGPGVGSGSRGTSGRPTVTKTFKTTANNQPATDTTSNSPAIASRGVSTGSGGGALQSVQASGGTVSSGNTAASGGTGSGCTCQQLQQTATTLLDPVTTLVGGTTSSLGI